MRQRIVAMVALLAAGTTGCTAAHQATRAIGPAPGTGTTRYVTITASPTPGHFDGVPECRSSQLMIHSGSGEQTMGRQYQGFAFVDRSVTTCAMRGYPGASFLDSHHRRLPIPVGRGFPTLPLNGCVGCCSIRAGARTSTSATGPTTP